MKTLTALTMSKHADRRAQQRAIPPTLLPLLLSYGEMIEQSGGSQVLRLPWRERDRLRRDLKILLSRLDALQDAYAVLAADTVITVAHDSSHR